MEHDEHEMLIEYSEMTAFDFNSKEYRELREDYIECKKAAHGIVSFVQSFENKFKTQTV